MVFQSYTVSGLDRQSAGVTNRNPQAGDAWEQNGQVCHTQDDVLFNLISKALTGFLPVTLERKITTCYETAQLARVARPSVREDLATRAREQGTTVRAGDLAAAGQGREGKRVVPRRPAPAAADLTSLRLAIAE